MTDRYAKLPSLTAGRGIAALMVATFHASNVWPNGSLAGVASFGWLGVAFFFVLSGFVLTWSRAEERSYSEFIVHRVARIFPVHLLCLAVSLGCFFVIGDPLGGYKGTVLGTILQLFLAHDFVPGHPNIRQAWDGVSWTLSAEFFFYLFAPFMIRFFLTLKNTTLLNCALAMYIVSMSIGVLAHKANLDHLYDFMQYHPIAYLPMFSYGIIGAILMRRGEQISLSTSVKFLLFVPLLVYCFRLEDRDAQAMVALAIPAFVAFIVDQARRDASGQKSLLAHSFLEKIGEISFSLYMVHALLLGAFRHLFLLVNAPYHPTIFTLIFLLSSLVLAYLTYEIVEKPMKNLLIARFSATKKVAPARINAPG